MNVRPDFDDLVLRGLSAKEISLLVGMEPTEIYKAARKRGLSFKRNRERMILDALAEGSKTSNEIAAASGNSVSSNAIRARLSQLSKEGLVERVGERVRSWPQPCVRWALIKSSKARILDALADGPKELVALCVVIGINKKTVLWHLSGLIKEGLVEKIGPVQKTFPPARLSWRLVVRQ